MSGTGPEMAAAQRAAATNGPGLDLGPGPDPGSGSGPDPPREIMMGVSFLPTTRILFVDATKVSSDNHLIRLYTLLLHSSMWNRIILGTW